MPHAQIVDRSTGEITREFDYPEGNRLVSFPPSDQQRYRRPPFAAVYSDNIYDIMKKKHLTTSEAGFFLFLVHFLDWQGTSLVDRKNHAPLNESTLAAELGMERRHVWETLRTLNDKGMVFLINKGHGRPAGIMLNPNLFFFGKTVKDPTDCAHFDDCGYEPAKRVCYRKTPKD